MSKFIFIILFCIILFCAAMFGGQTGVNLNVTTLAASPRGPAAFVQVDVLTPKGKRIASAFTSAQGLAAFRLPEGEYVVAARSNNISQCQTGNTKYISQCSGQQRVAIQAGMVTAQISVELHSVQRPSGGF